VLVGGGELKEQVLAEIRRLGLDEEVKLTGTIPHDKVIAHYQQADIFVLGCQIADNGDRDGIPNVLAEAMAMGVPPVATDVSGIPELLIDRQTGLSVQAKDPKALAEAMERMLTDQDLRTRVIPAAKQKVHEVFDNRRLIRDLAQVYLDEGLGPRITRE
jgi:glycosyltransferase involved in cell wall biosynthesis